MHHKNENNHSFNQLSKNDWWDTNGNMHTLHDINNARLDFVLQSINHQNINTLKVLDLGCGGGVFSEELAKKNMQVTGIDISDQAINIAINHAIEAKLDITYQAIDVKLFAQNATEKFDLITCMDMIEHVDNIEEIIGCIRKLLKHNGLLFISTINRNLLSYVGAILFAEYIFKLIPIGMHRYQKFIKPSELTKILSDYNFDIINLSGIQYNPLTRNSSLSTKNVAINYILVAKKI